MHPLIEFTLFCFTSLFTMVNPIGVSSVFTTMTAGMTARQATRTAQKASLMAFLLMIMFALTGQFIFDFFSITVDSLRVVGGILFFSIGFEMLQARISRTQHDDETVTEYAEDIAITPLAIPIICGPGSITMVIVLFQNAETLTRKGIVLGVITLVMAITLGFLLGGRPIINALGENGNKLMIRLMGLITMVIAVEFFFAGLRPIIQDILQITPG